MTNFDHPTIDILSLISTPLKRTSSYKGGQYSGPCPLCGGTDRFNAYPDLGRWFCRQCHPKWGDAIDLIQNTHGLDFKAACAHLNITLEQGDYTRQQTQKAEPPPVRPSEQQPDYPALNPAYQVAALDFIGQCQHNLQRSSRARHYLAERGVTGLVQRLYRIGYNLRTQHAQWGEQQVYLPRGIVIPWMTRHFVSRVNIRVHDDERAQNPDLPKYIPAAGGVTHTLYKQQHIRNTSTIILVETELDAIAIESLGMAHRITPVALGSVTNGLTVRNVSRLSTTRHVYIATDADQAGYNAYLRWEYALGKKQASRLMPDNTIDDTAKDPGDIFARFGYRCLRHWLQPALTHTTYTGALTA